MRRPQLTAHDLKLRQQQAEDAQLLKNPAFRRFVFALLRDAGIFTPATASTPHGTAISVGRQSLGFEVLHRLYSADPEFLPLVMREGELLKVTAAQPPGDDDDGSDEPEPE